MTSTEGGRSRGILAAVALALFCVQIDYFAMNLALPRIAFEFGSTASDLQWVISVYMLALGAFMVPAGRQRGGMSAGGAIDSILAVLSALLPAGVAVLLIARRAATESASSHPPA